MQIDREADLLNRGRKPATLAALRKRTSGLFLAFTETPEFNPEAAALQVRPALLPFYASNIASTCTVHARVPARDRPRGRRAAGARACKLNLSFA